MGADTCTADDIDDLRSEARYILEAKNDRARAIELAKRAQEMLPKMDAPLHEQADVYAAMAALWSDLGDDALVEPLISKALDIEASLAKRRPIILGTRH